MGRDARVPPRVWGVGSWRPRVQCSQLAEAGDVGVVATSQRLWVGIQRDGLPDPLA
jgi:hypothetical protein